jgi:hypothetical protein
MVQWPDDAAGDLVAETAYFVCAATFFATANTPTTAMTVADLRDLVLNIVPCSRMSVNTNLPQETLHCGSARH